MINDSFIGSLILSLTIETAVLGIILFARKFFLRKTSYPMVEILWIIFIFYLLIPIFPDNPLSITSVLSKINHSAFEDMGITTNAAKAAIQSSSGIEPVFTYKSNDNHAGLFMIIYISCASVLLFTSIFRIRKNHKRLRGSFSPPGDRLNNLFNRMTAELCLNNKKAGIVITPEASPFVLGIRKPAIAIPVRLLSLEDQKLSSIIAHELTHIKRNDNLKLYLTTGLRLLLFFHPLIHIISYFYRIDIELICDYCTLKRIRSHTTLTEYMHTIVEVIQRSSFPNGGLTDDCAFIGRKNNKARLEYISTLPQKDRPRFFRFIILIISCLILFTGRSNALPLSAVIQNQYAEHTIRSGIIACVRRTGTEDILTNNPGMVGIPQRALSTIKVPISYYLIDTDTAHAGYILPWDETEYEYPVWQQDQSLASALKYSVSWYYGTMLERVEKSPLNNYLKKSGYSNVISRKLSGIDDYLVTTKISPLKQVYLMEDLIYNAAEDPSSAELLDMMFISQANGYKIFGKTGTGSDGSQTEGWFIGAAVSGDDRICFSYYSNKYAGKDLKDAVIKSFSDTDLMRKLINLRM